jgi:hypothetical protein
MRSRPATFESEMTDQFEGDYVARILTSGTEQRVNVGFRLNRYDCQAISPSSRKTLAS